MTQPLCAWRNGVHIVGTPLWCDARHSRDVCFLSSARAEFVRKHGQLIATEETVRLVSSAGGPRMLSVPPGRPFSLGELRLELLPSGYYPGAASLIVNVRGQRLLYAGMVNLRGSALTPPCELRTCDILVLNATFGHPRFVFPPREEVEERLGAWIAEVILDGATPVLFVEPRAPLPALPRAPIRAHRALVLEQRKLAELGYATRPMRQLAGTPARGEIVLWPAKPAGRLVGTALAAIRRPRRALVSGWARDADALGRAGAEIGFPWPDQAGYDELIRYVAQSEAAIVHLLGEADELRAQLTSMGVKAHHLAPGIAQLSLFA